MYDDQLTKLIDNYQPSANVMSALTNVQLVATVAPSASGKTTLMNAAAKTSPEVSVVLGHTSRQPRQNETVGVDYIFRERDEIIKDVRAGNLVDVVIGPNGDLYGTQINSYSQTGINTMALVASSINTFRQLPFKIFRTVFIVPSTYDRWQEWLASQAQTAGWTETDMKGRLNEAIESYKISLADKDMLFVLNDEIDTSAARLLQIMHGQTPNDQDRAIEAANQNYKQLIHAHFSLK